MACPAGPWHAGGDGCYLLTNESDTHRGCVERCTAWDGQLACIRTVAEQHAVQDALNALNNFSPSQAALPTSQLPDDHAWIGLYQWPVSDGPSVGWNACASGEAVSFTDWYSEPAADFHNVMRDCASASWLPLSAEGRVSHVTWRETECAAKHPCLCSFGGLSTSTSASAYYDAVADRLHVERSHWTASEFVQGWSILIITALLPSLYALAHLCASRARGHVLRGKVLPPNQSRELTRAARERPSEEAVELALASALRKGKALRRRVRFYTLQVGWALFIFGMVPEMLNDGFVFGRFPGFHGRSSGAMMGLFPPGLMTCLLALSPVDRCLIDAVCVMIVCVLTLMTCALGVWPLRAILRGQGLSDLLAGFASMVPGLLLGLMIAAPTVRCGNSAMSARAKLRRIWIALRIGMGWVGLCMLVGGWMAAFNPPAVFAPTGLSIFAFSVLMTPTVRARVTRYFGSIGSQNYTEQQQAAAVAALIGTDEDAAHALQMAKDRFRTLDLDRLSEADLARKTADPTLHAKTQPAELGQCDAFVSHSWVCARAIKLPLGIHLSTVRTALLWQSDEGARKYETLLEWRVGAGGAPRSIWLDKVRCTCRLRPVRTLTLMPLCFARRVYLFVAQACINQQSIDESLMCLPVFLSGCQQLLVIAGATCKPCRDNVHTAWL